MEDDSSMPETILSGLKEVSLSEESSRWCDTSWNAHMHAVTHMMEDMLQQGEDVKDDTKAFTAEN